MSKHNLFIPVFISIIIIAGFFSQKSVGSTGCANLAGSIFPPAMVETILQRRVLEAKENGGLCAYKLENLGNNTGNKSIIFRAVDYSQTPLPPGWNRSALDWALFSEGYNSLRTNVSYKAVSGIGDEAYKTFCNSYARKDLLFIQFKTDPCSDLNEMYYSPREYTVERTWREDLLEFGFYRTFVPRTPNNNPGGPTPFIPTPTTTVSATPTPDTTELDDPIVTSFSPSTITAGVKQSFNEDSGNVVFTNRAYVLEIDGQNLQGATISANNTGVDGRLGIIFQNVESSPDGTTARAHLISRPTATDFETEITLTNRSGKSTSFSINVTITGTQYLKRQFSDDPRVKFFGDWEEIVPNEKILLHEWLIETGVESINKNSYNRLGIISHFYENDYWERTAATKFCEAPAGGCAGPDDNIIYVSLNDSTDLIIYHEAAHKLHFYYSGSYLVQPPVNSFEADWRSQLGDLSQCLYLPARGYFNWSDGSNGPRCGFIAPYGSSETNKGFFFEDVATYAETLKFSPNIVFDLDDSDLRYQGKINLINRYDF